MSYVHDMCNVHTYQLYRWLLANNWYVLQNTLDPNLRGNCSYRNSNEKSRKRLASCWSPFELGSLGRYLYCFRREETKTSKGSSFSLGWRWITFFFRWNETCAQQILVFYIATTEITTYYAVLIDLYSYFIFERIYLLLNTSARSLHTLHNSRGNPPRCRQNKVRTNGSEPVQTVGRTSLPGCFPCRKGRIRIDSWHHDASSNLGFNLNKMLANGMLVCRD